MDGNVMLSTDLDTRPVIQSLSNLKRKIVEVFKGADVKSLQLGLKEVTAELKATEAQARKAQTALDALMSGEKTPQSVKDLEKELASTEKQAEKMSKGYDKMLAAVDKYRDYEGLSTTSFPEAQKFYDAQAALERYEKEWEELDLKAERLRNTIDELKQNPQLTPEAQKYSQTLDETSRKLTELRSKQNEYAQAIEMSAERTKVSQRSMLDGFKAIENRIVRLAKRVLFFSLITMALRNLRKYIGSLISADSELSASLAQVKGNLATAFGMIWSAVLPAIRAMINFLAKATAYLAAFISWLTGKSFKAGRDAFESANKASAGTAKNTGKIGKAAKKAAKEAQRMLLPFDQMNVLSKDSADGGGAGGGGGGLGGMGGLGGITWPKQMDITIAKLEAFKDLILLIGAAFAGWKLSRVLAPLLNLSKGATFVALTAIILGISEFVLGLRDLIKEGPDVNNVCQIISGAIMTLGGVLVLLGHPIGLIVIAIGALILAFRHLYNSNKTVKKWLDTIIKLFKEKKFKEAGKMIIQGVLKGMFSVIKKVGGWIKKKIVDPIIKWFKKRFGIASPAKKMLDIGKNIMLGVLKGMLEPLKKIGDWVQEHVLTPIKEALFGDGEDKDGLFVNISAKFSDTKETISKKWTELTSDIKDKIVTIVSEVKEKVKGAIDTLKTKWSEIKDKTVILTNEIKEKVKNGLDTLKTKWDSIKDKTATLISDVKEKTAGVLATLKTNWDSVKDRTVTLTADVKEKAAGVLDTLKTAWTSISDKTVTLIGTAKDNTGTVLNSLKSAWGTITTKTATLTTKLNQKAKWKTLTTVKSAFASIKSKTATLTVSLKASVGGAYNRAAKKINGLISRLPKSVRPSWRLPYLAKGAVIPANKEFLAVLGDQKRGVNIETPLQTMVDAFNMALRANGVGGPQSVNVYLQGDAKQLFRVVRVEANNYTQSTGRAAFNL